MTEKIDVNEIIKSSIEKNCGDDKILYNLIIRSINFEQDHYKNDLPNPELINKYEVFLNKIVKENE